MAADTTSTPLVLAAAALQSGRTADALNHLDTVVADAAVPVQTLLEAARLAGAAGDHHRSAQWYERASALLPSKAVRFAHALALMEAGELARAEGELRRALAKSPAEFQFLNLLGVVLKRAGRLQEAVEQLQKAAKADPKAASAWTNLGNCHMELRAPAKAAECFERGSKLDPRNAETHRLLGRALMAAGKSKEAVAAFKQALQRGSKSPWAVVDLAQLLRNQQRPEEALQIIETALAAQPGQTDLRRVHASLLRSNGRVDEARAGFEALLAEHPDDVDAIVMLGNLYLWGLNQHRQANAMYERALALQPDHVEAAKNYCESLSNSRYGNEAEHFENAYAQASALLARQQGRDTLSLAGSLQGIFLRAADYTRQKALGDPQALFKLWVEQMQVAHLHNQLGRVESLPDRLALLQAHRAWGDKVQAQARHTPVQRRGTPPPRHKIRLGLMSSDLRNHPVMYFAQPLLEHLDRTRFDVFCYSFHPNSPDPVQQQVASQVTAFRNLPNQTHRSIAQHIADDHLDILFELGGTTQFNHVQVCAWRPAPVQVSWLGYPHSAGLSHIDYILVDPHNCPERADLLVEKPFLMPSTWVALGDLGFNDIPIEPGLPQDRQGCFTFGTANNPYKFTPQCFAAWAEAMAQVSDSRFLFVRPEGGSAAFRANVQAQFAAHGVAAERVLFEAVRGKHMPHYNRIDIALDPFPHVGGTTTCESLWMGVPVVTLQGPAFFERLSASNLHNAGLGDLCARDADEYVRIAVALAQDRPRRAELRHGLRAQIRQHPLGQGERFAHDFAATVERTLQAHRPA